MAVSGNNPYANLMPNNLNSNAKVYFLNGQLGTSQGDESLKNLLESLSKTSPQIPQNIYQAPTLPTRPASTTQAIQTAPQFVQTVINPYETKPMFTQSSAPTQTSFAQSFSTQTDTHSGTQTDTQAPRTNNQQPQVQVTQLPAGSGYQQQQTLMLVSGPNGPQIVNMSNGGAFPGGLATPCNAVQIPNGTVVTNVNNSKTYLPQVMTAPTPAPPLQPVMGPNAAGGWYPAMQVVKARIPESEYLKMLQWQQPILANPSYVAPDQIRYPTVPNEKENINSELATIEKETVIKTKSSRHDMLVQMYIRETRTIGAVLTLLGSLTIGLGIAGVILYHIGKNTTSGLSWCSEAHAFNNGLTQALMPSSPGINYVTSGAGIIGIMTFLVGVLNMCIDERSGPLLHVAINTSFITLPCLVIMCILSTLSFIMTFGISKGPSCTSLTVVTFLVVVLAIVPFILLLVLYCRMQRLIFNRDSRAISVTPMRSVSVIKVGAAPAGMIDVHAEVERRLCCAYECCPCCAPPAPCCPGCAPHVVHEDDHHAVVEKKETTKKPEAVAAPEVTMPAYPPCMMPTGCQATPALRYPCANRQYLWGQVAPYGMYGKSAYNPYMAVTTAGNQKRW